MKGFLSTLLFFAIAGCAIATDQRVIPIYIGAQWPTDKFEFSPSCGSPTMGGYNCIYFPNGAIIRHINWSSNLKDGPQEVLLLLVMTRGKNLEGYRSILLSTEQNTKDGPLPPVVRQIDAPRGIYVPPGSYVWIYGQATDRYNWPIVEIQTTLLVDLTTYEAINP